MTFKITYSVLNADLTELHKEFDASLAKVRAGIGQEYPSWINNKAYSSGKFIEDRNPADTRELLAKFHTVDIKELDHVLEVSQKAQWTWGKTTYPERVRLINKAAELISERRMEIAAIMSLETGKNRMEALGDVEEAADLFRYYALQLEEAKGFLKPLNKLSPNEDTRSVLRPYGVFAVISPFNFPLALAAGMSAGALLGGNTVILKPSQDTPWCGHKLFEVLRDAGLPEGVFQVLHGTGAELGAALVKHPKLDGIVFTGSKDVGMQLLRNFSTVFPKPCFLELGGKNPTIVCEKADLEKAAEGCIRSAFGMSGQKCSALSRIYVHESVKPSFMDLLIEKAKKVVIGDPARKETFVGPVINERAYKRYLNACRQAADGAKIVFGGRDIKAQEAYKHGWFVEPTIFEAPHTHALMRDELFLPFLGVASFKTLPEALQMANDCDYGLTAGIFSERKEDVEYFMDNVEAGVLYANRQTGATTGAWPGVQAFCGWKGSGSTGKGGCGPYYVSQFMREQSQTRML